MGVAMGGEQQQQHGGGGGGMRVLPAAQHDAILSAAFAARGFDDAEVEAAVRISRLALESGAYYRSATQGARLVDADGGHDRVQSTPCARCAFAMCVILILFLCRGVCHQCERLIVRGRAAFAQQAFARTMGSRHSISTTSSARGARRDCACRAPR